MKNQLILNGNQAVAYAAMDAHVRHFSHYPGSPVNKVDPMLKQLNDWHDLGIAFNDAHNEHIAACASIGASYANVRSMLVMKHVGLNIAADPLNYAGYSGVRGGLVLVVGTDPGANSSTGEQDVHWYARMFNFPLFEPTGIQDIYNQTLSAFALSEQYEVPVMIFIPGELAYSMAQVKRQSLPANPRKIGFVKNRKKYINVGQKAIDNHAILIDKMRRFSETENHSNRYFSSTAPLGIITRGLAFNYVMEVVDALGLQEQIDLLHCTQVYPVAKSAISDFVKNKQKIVCIEDQDGFLELMIKQYFFNEIQCPVYGKDIFPEHGALSTELVRAYFAKEFKLESEAVVPKFFEIEERIGTFCEGCPHTSSYYAIFDSLKGRDFVLGGDIGCSSLPPFRADWLLCMNAGIGISQGIAQVSKEQLVISTGGDGSFFHGGLISLQSAVENKINLIHVVFDNAYVAMTGHQYSPSANPQFDPVALCESVGVHRIHVVDVFERGAFKQVLEDELDQSGVRVIWAKGACALATEAARGDEAFTYSFNIDTNQCGSCRACYEQLACPSIREDQDLKAIFIDESRCVRCGTCHSICPNDAIHIKTIRS